MSFRKHFKFILVTIIYFSHIYFRRLPITLLPLIRLEIPLTSDDIGLLVSGHAFTYTVGRLLFGVASDKYSKVALLLTGLITCASCSVGIAFSSHFWQLFISLLLLGIVQGAGWVPAALLVQNWYTKSNYGTMFSILSCGSTFAGILQPFSKKIYWRDVELYTGVGMLLFSIVCFYGLREDNSPQYLEEDDDGNTKKNKSQGGLRTAFGSLIIWHIAFIYLFTMEMRTICEAWVQLFLTDSGISPDVYQITYEIGGLVGTMASGIIIDLATRKFDVDGTRRVIAISYTCLMMITATGIFELPSLSSVFGFFAGMFVNGSINVWCMIAAQAGYVKIQGTVSAFISFVASFGSMLAGSPLAFLISQFGYHVFIYIFAIQLSIVLIVSSFRVRLRMGVTQKTKTTEEEDRPKTNETTCNNAIVELESNLTELEKKTNISTIFAFNSSKNVSPVEEKRNTL